MKKLLSLFCFCLAAFLSVNAQVVNHMPIISISLNQKPIRVIHVSNLLTERVIELFPGDTMRLVISATDQDSDSVKIASNFTSIFPGATFNVTGIQNPTAFIYWVPTVTDVSLIPSGFWYKVSDYFSTTHANIINTLGVRVNKPGSIELNNGPVNLNQDIELEPGMPMNLRFSSVNPASSNAFSISSNVTSALPGATFTTDNATQQTANINFTPTAAQINSQPYAFSVTYQDNAPVPNQYVYHVRVKVGSSLLGISKIKSEGISFSAFPNPFSENVVFQIDEKVKADKIVIYNLLGQQLDQINLTQLALGSYQVKWEKAGRFAKGTYLARLIQENKQVQTIRFIKQ